jgi:APA family basic amino acid/polyamine antiporter
VLTTENEPSAPKRTDSEHKRYCRLTTTDVFARKASGLVRDVGLWSGLLYNITVTAPVISVGVFLPYLFLYSSGGNYLLGITIGTVCAILIGSVYAHFTTTMPRSGGEYVFLSRSLHPALGFIVNFTLVCNVLFWWPFNQIFLASITTSILSAFTTLPAASYAWLSTPEGLFVFGVGIMLAQVMLSFFGVKHYLRIQNVVYALLLVVTAILTVGFVSAWGTFPSTFNIWAQKYVPGQPDMYNNIIQQAAAAGFSLNPPESPMLEQTLIMAAVFASYVIPFTVFTSYIAGEIKKASSGIRQHLIIEVTALFYFVNYVLLGWTFVEMGGLKFLSSLAYLGSVQNLPVNIYYWSFPAVMLPAWASLFTYVVLWFSFIPLEAAAVIMMSRCMFAWSFDRIIPTAFSHVSNKYRTPTYALGLIMVLVTVLMALAVWANIFVYIAASVFWILINFSIVCIAGIVFPYLRKDMFEQMPIKARVAGIPLLSIISAAGLIFLLWTATAYFINPDFLASTGITTVSIEATVFIYAVALAIFYSSRAYWRRHGIDLDSAFRQIPPA